MPDPTEYHTVVKDSLGYGKKVRQPDIIKTEVIKVTHQTISLVCERYINGEKQGKFLRMKIL